MVQKRKIKNLTTLDQVMVFCDHFVQCGVCDHHIPLGKIGLGHLYQNSIQCISDINIFSTAFFTIFVLRGSINVVHRGKCEMRHTKIKMERELEHIVKVAKQEKG